MARLVSGEQWVRDERGRWRKATGFLDRLVATERHRDCGTGRFMPLSARTTGCGPRVCYASRAELARAFGRWLGERYGAGLESGAGKDSRGFDAVNEKYELKGRRKVRTLRAAILAVCPSRGPFCLDAIDLKTLNESTPAREAGGFELPDAVYERRALVAQVEAEDEELCQESACSHESVPF